MKLRETKQYFFLWKLVLFLIYSIGTGSALAMKPTKLPDDEGQAPQLLEVDPTSNPGKLFSAVKKNDRKTSYNLVKGNFRLLKQTDPDGFTPFHRTVQRGFHELVRDFMKGVGNTSKQLAHGKCDDENGYSPMCLAVLGGTPQHDSCMDLLCRTPNCSDCFSKNGWAPTQLAAMYGKPKTLNHLLNNGWSKTIHDEQKRTLMHLAAAYSPDERVIDVLIKHNLSLKDKDKYGLTPLHWAARTGNHKLVKYLLLKYADPLAQDKDGWVPIHWALQGGHTQTSDLLLASWPPPPSLIKKIYKGHAFTVWSVVFSHDSKLLASSASSLFEESNNTVWLWDVEKGSLVKVFKGHNSVVNSVVFSHDSKLLASASDDETVRLWDVEKGSLVKVFKGHNSVVNSVVFSHDSKLLASASEDNTVRVWNVESGKLIRTFQGHTDSVTSVVFSHDSKLLASASEDNTVHVWDVGTGRFIKQFKGHTGSVTSVMFSHDSKLLASASYDKTVRLWNVATGSLSKVFKGHTSYVNSVVFSHDGKQLASAGSDKTVRLWDVAIGSLVKVLQGHTSGVWSVVFSHDSKLLASASWDKTVRLWDPTWETVIHHAIRSGKKETLKLIVSRKPQLLHVRNPQGMTPFDLAKELGYKHLFHILEQGNALENNGKTSKNRIGMLNDEPEDEKDDQKRRLKRGR